MIFWGYNQHLNKFSLRQPGLPGGRAGCRHRPLSGPLAGAPWRGRQNAVAAGVHRKGARQHGMTVAPGLL